MKKCDKIVLLAKTKLNTIKVLLYKALINPYINHEEFVAVNNVLREYNDTQEEIKNPENTVEYTIKNNGNILCQKKKYCKQKF